MTRDPGGSSLGSPAKGKVKAVSTTKAALGRLSGLAELWVADSRFWYRFVLAIHGLQANTTILLRLTTHHGHCGSGEECR